MEECMRKLALWHTKTFKPIMTHEELEPIMATLGFKGLPPTTSSGIIAWKEYVYMATSITMTTDQSVPPRARLPYPTIDGLHLHTYRAFIHAVNFYHDMADFSDLFHIRGLSLHSNHDRNRKWRRMEEEETLFIYREGTLNQTTYDLDHLNINNDNALYSLFIHRKSKDIRTPTICFISIGDINSSTV